MTDKPEVVEFNRYGRSMPVYGCNRPVDMSGAYISLTDHEASRAADKARIAELERERDEWHRLFDSAGQVAKNACDDLNSAKSRIAELEAEKARCFIPEGVWHEGCPRHPYGSEWFIAKLDNGQRVVLKELPEEHSYDYRTADETYYSAYRIAAWMQFPDSQYVAALAQQGAASTNDPIDRPTPLFNWLSGIKVMRCEVLPGDVMMVGNDLFTLLSSTPKQGKEGGE